MLVGAGKSGVGSRVIGTTGLESLWARARAGARAGLGLPRVLPTPGVVDATNAVA